MLQDWLEATRPYHLTIQYVLNMQPGDRIFLLHIDRNFCDHIDRVCNGSDAVRVEAVLPYGYSMTFEKGPGGLQGKSFGDFFGEGRSFEFDIEYRPGDWYPLREGRLPAPTPEDDDFDVPDAVPHFSWEQYPDTTRLGWRGPCIPVSCLRQLPPIRLL
jgi:hypothetical protein